MTSPDRAQVRVFISYAREDRDWCNRVQKHLGWLTNSQRVWAFDDSQLGAGEEWDPAIAEELRQADIIILIVTASFMASRYCTTIELRTALERRERGVHVIPIIADHCDWMAMPIQQLQAMPKDPDQHLKPLAAWSNANEALSQIASAVRSIVETLRPNGMAPRTDVQGATAARSGGTSAFSVQRRASEPLFVLNRPIRDRLDNLQRNMDAGDWHDAAQSGFQALEGLLRETLKSAVAKWGTLPALGKRSGQGTLAERVQKELGAQHQGRSLDQLTLGQLVGVIRQAGFVDDWEERTGLDLTGFRSIDLGFIVTIRNRSAHGADLNTEAHAKAIAECLTKLLNATGVDYPRLRADREHSVQQRLDRFDSLLNLVDRSPHALEVRHSIEPGMASRRPLLFLLYGETTQCLDRFLERVKGELPGILGEGTLEPRPLKWIDVDWPGAIRSVDRALDLLRGQVANGLKLPLSATAVGIRDAAALLERPVVIVHQVNAEQWSANDSVLMDRWTQFWSTFPEIAPTQLLAVFVAALYRPVQPRAGGWRRVLLRSGQGSRRAVAESMERAAAAARAQMLPDFLGPAWLDTERWVKTYVDQQLAPNADVEQIVDEVRAIYGGNDRMDMEQIVRELKRLIRPHLLEQSIQ